MVNQTVKRNIYNEEVYYLHSGINDFFTVFHFGRTMPDVSYLTVHGSASPYHILEFVNSGVGYIENGKTVEKVTAGDFYCLNKLADARFYSDHETPYDKFFLSLYGELPDHLVSAFYGDKPYHIFHAGDNAGEYAALFGKLRGLLCWDIPDLSSRNLMEVSNLVFRMMSLSAEELHYGTLMGEPTLADELRRYFDSSLTKEQNLTEAAAEFSISVTHLIRVFKEKYNVTPKQYIMKRRIAAARLMLSDTSMTVQQIAEKLCFSDSNYFSVVFRRYTDMTPSEYRSREDWKNYIVNYTPQ